MSVCRWALDKPGRHLRPDWLLAGLRADDPGLPKEEDLAGMSIAQLKAHLNKYSISSRDCVERGCDTCLAGCVPSGLFCGSHALPPPEQWLSSCYLLSRKATSFQR